MNGSANLDVIFEDGHLLVLNKPSGFLTVPAPKKGEAALSDVVRRALGRRVPPESAMPCHRLDRETSGVLVFAKTPAAERAVKEQFKARGVRKRYIAFASGHPGRKEGEVRGYISTEPPYFGKGCRGGEYAVTRWRMLDRREGVWVAEVEPLTGRTNQIRIHFKQIGCPILGDRRYAYGRDFAVKFPRVALHAERIAFTHPATGKGVSFTAPLPPDMRDFLAAPQGR